MLWMKFSAGLKRFATSNKSHETDDDGLMQPSSRLLSLVSVRYGATNPGIAMAAPG
jgi:hypothetical protein